MERRIYNGLVQIIIKLLSIMKLCREIFNPFIQLGNPEEVAQNQHFLETLQKVTVCFGCTEEELTLKELVGFFGLHEFLNLCVQTERFDILTCKHMECEFLKSGQYLEEIYRSIKTQTPEWLQDKFLARFCDCGQSEFLKEKKEWAALAKSNQCWSFLLLKSELSVFLLMNRAKVSIQEDGLYALEPNNQLFEQVYEKYGRAPFDEALNLLRKKGHFGTIDVLNVFLQTKEKN